MASIYSPILEQAGFLKRKAAVVVEEWVAQLDGVTQYWQLSEPIIINEGYEIYFTFVNTEIGSNSYLLCSNEGTTTGIFTSSSSGALLSTVGVTMTLDVDGNGNGFEVVTYDGEAHSVVAGVFGSGSFQKLCTRFNESRTLSGWIKGFTVKNEVGEIVSKIPLTNKAQGATQLATVGSVNATLINYTDAVWRKP